MEPYPSPQEDQPFHAYGAPMISWDWRARHPSLYNETHYHQRGYSENAIYPRLLDRLSSSQTCFNCGSPEHWIQDCPQPRRFNPHSSGAEVDFRPSKRRRTSDPPLASHAFPPPYRRQWGDSSPGFRSNYPVYNNFPPTPKSSHSADLYPWQGSPYQSSPRQSFPLYGPHGMPTPTSTYDTNFQSQGSHYSGHYDYFQRQQQFPLNSENPQFIYSQHNQYPPEHGRWGPPLHPQPSGADDPPSRSPGQPWMEDMQSYEGQAGGKTFRNQITWQPPTVAARPLPSSFPAREEREPFSSNETPQSGMSASKYISDQDAEDSNRHIRETKYWSSLKDDPIFRVIDTNCELISIEELVSRRNRILHTHSLRSLNETENGEADKADVEADRDRPSNDRSRGYGKPPRQETQHINGRVSPRERNHGTGRRRFHDRHYSARNSTRKGPRIYPGNRHQRLERQAGDANSSSSDRHVMPGSYLDPMVQPYEMQSVRDSENCRNVSPKPEYTPGRGVSGKQQPPPNLSDHPCQDEKARSCSSRGPPQPETTKGRKRSRPIDSSANCYNRPRRQGNDTSSKSGSWGPETASIYRYFVSPGLRRPGYMLTIIVDDGERLLEQTPSSVIG